MDKIKEFDMLKYLDEYGCVYLDSLDIKDCIISGKQSESVYIANCIFHNVKFEDYFQYCDVTMEMNQFKDCEFHGKQGKLCKSFQIITCTFENVKFHNHFIDSLVSVEDCNFSHCEFRGWLGTGELELSTSQFKNSIVENLNMGTQGESVLVANCEFQNCSLRNIEIKRENKFHELDIVGGDIEHFNCINSDIQGCHFFNVHLKEVYLEANFLDNDMDSVVFRNVVLKGTMRDKADIDENVFIKCDTSGFTYL